MGGVDICKIKWSFYEVFWRSSSPSTAPVHGGTLKKKSNSIASNIVREGCAADEWRITYVNTNDNPSDLMTKCLAPGEKRDKFVKMLVRYVSAAGA